MGRSVRTPANARTAMGTRAASKGKENAAPSTRNASTITKKASSSNAPQAAKQQVLGTNQGVFNI